MRRVIPYGKQTIDKYDKKNVAKALNNSFLTTGPLVEKFEKEFSKNLGVRYAISCSSGTAAMHLALRAINLKKNDKIIIPAINFISTINLAKLIGANIFLADVDQVTGQMTPATLLQCLKKNKLKKIKAFFTMHNGGHPLNLKEFYIIKKKLKLFW